MTKENTQKKNLVMISDENLKRLRILKANLELKTYNDVFTKALEMLDNEVDI